MLFPLTTEQFLKVSANGGNKVNVGRFATRVLQTLHKMLSNYLSSSLLFMNSLWWKEFNNNKKNFSKYASEIKSYYKNWEIIFEIKKWNTFLTSFKCTDNSEIFRDPNHEILQTFLSSQLLLSSLTSMSKSFSSIFRLIKIYTAKFKVVFAIFIREELK